MESIKAATEHKAMIIERMKGLFTEEGKDYESNYTFRCNSKSFTIKKAEESKMEKEKFIVEFYGDNIKLEELREFMKLCRTQVRFH